MGEMDNGDYKVQLELVNKALEKSTCQNERLELESLRANILELLELTEQISNDEEVDAEMQRFMTEVHEMESKAESKGELSSEFEREYLELRADMEKMVGKKCSAPHRHVWDAVSYHNAIICGIEDTADNGEAIYLRVLFTNPTHLEMLPCPYFLEGDCRYDETRCHYSHGEIVSLSDLREYMEPDFSRLARNCEVLAKSNDRLWHRGRVLCANFVEKQCRVRIDGKNENGTEKDYNFEDLLPIIHDEELSGESSSDDCSGSDSEKNFDGTLPQESSIQQSLFYLEPNQALGEWERHTKRIGSKLMEKMGYKMGTGLGSGGQGIVIPISAQILPQGRSLDYCMELRNAANGDKNLFSVERKLYRARKKQEESNLRAYERECERKDVFSFLNDNVLGTAKKESTNKRNESTTINLRLESHTTKSLNIDSVRISDDIRRKQREIAQTKESLQRNADSTEMQKRLKSQLSIKIDELQTLQRVEKNLKVEQASRKTKNKMSIF